MPLNRLYETQHPLAGYLSTLGTPAASMATPSGGGTATRYNALMQEQPAGQQDMRDPEAYERWRQLLMARYQQGANQQRLGPREHGAFAESMAREHPVLGPLSMLAAIPAYNAAKGAGLIEGWFDPSVDAMAEGYRGIGRGVKANIRDLLD